MKTARSELQTPGPVLASEASMKAPAPPRKSKARTLIPLAGLLVLAGIGYPAYRFFLSKPAAPSNILRLAGRIEGDDSAVATKVTGRILEIRVREGDSVKAGDVIAVLDDPQVHAREQTRPCPGGGRGSAAEARRSSKSRCSTTS